MSIESQELVSPRPKSNILKWVPVASLIVSSCSFMFAVAVLYPWHLALSDQFSAMKDTCLQSKGH